MHNKIYDHTIVSAPKQTYVFLWYIFLDIVFSRLTAQVGYLYVLYLHSNVIYRKSLVK